MRARTTPPVIASGEVVQVRPALLTAQGASLYAAVSVSKLEQLRANDAQAKRQGRPLSGPRWIVLGKTMVRYRTNDLDAWIKDNAEELGVAEAYRRGAAS